MNRTMGFALALSLVLAARAGAQDGDGMNAPVPGEQVETLRERIEADPILMGKVTDLQDDEEMADVLDDPAIAAALRRGDMGALLANPKIGRLMNHPTVREITRDLSE